MIPLYYYFYLKQFCWQRKRSQSDFSECSLKSFFKVRVCSFLKLNPRVVRSLNTTPSLFWGSHTHIHSYRNNIISLSSCLFQLLLCTCSSFFLTLSDVFLWQHMAHILQCFQWNLWKTFLKALVIQLPRTDIRIPSIQQNQNQRRRCRGAPGVHAKFKKAKSGRKTAFVLRRSVGQNKANKPRQGGGKETQKQ